MKKLKRNPLRFEGFQLFTEYAKKTESRIGDASTVASLALELQAEITGALSNKAFLYGHRTQNMFEAMVVSLGAVALVKQEDAGECYAVDAEMGLPDFRIVLGDGTQMLVEVKNFNGAQTAEYEEKASYLDGLSRYSQLTGCQLRIAIYWRQWNQWTLVPLTAFTRQGDKLGISFPVAYTKNELAVLGDLFIGTRFPLTLRVTTDSVPVDGEPGSFRLTIRRVQLFCAGQEITRDDEKAIALFLMMNSNWPQESPASIVDGRVESFEIHATPHEDHGRGFEIVGSLSGLFCSAFAYATTDQQGTLEQLRITVDPGSLGQMIPADYQGEALPLWRFSFLPADSTNPAESAPSK
jgi:hypothetical protein